VQPSGVALLFTNVVFKFGPSLVVYHHHDSVTSESSLTG